VRVRARACPLGHAWWKRARRKRAKANSRGQGKGGSGSESVRTRWVGDGEEARALCCRQEKTERDNEVVEEARVTVTVKPPRRRWRATSLRKVVD
jgi:hypothetical protein